MSNVSLLQEFEQQFSTVTAEITTKICHLLKKETLSPQDILTTQEELENLLKDANELLERMELEVRDAPQDQREKLRNRVKSYEAELKRLKKEYHGAVQSTKAENEERIRGELFTHDDSEVDTTHLSAGDEQRQRLLNNTETLERTSGRLLHSYKVALQSEEVGAQILNDLQHQRSTITRARNRLHDTDEELTQSSRVLNAMMKRFLQNKFVLSFVLATVAIVIFLVIYLRLFR